jgi:hypothetical protein
MGMKDPEMKGLSRRMNEACDIENGRLATKEGAGDPPGTIKSH